MISDSFQYVPIVIVNDTNEKQKEREGQKNKTIVRYYDIISEGLLESDLGS